jgi:hypothetical protein
MTNKLISRFLSGIILFFFTGNLFAINLYDNNKFDEKVFTYHFDRADREADPTLWMEQAKKGVALAVSEWERNAVDFYTDPDFYKQASDALLLWTQEELEKRFVQWLFNRFFGDTAGEMARKMDAALEEANRLYSYHTGEDGKILYDETGAPLVIRPNDERSVEEDRALWVQQFASAGKEELLNYQNKVSFLFPELLGFIDKDKRAGFEENLNEAFGNAVITKKSEFDALVAREERNFIARRTGDLYSLRKQSENESAAMIVSQLIREAENNCMTGIASLEARIEAAKAGTGDLALAGEEWLAAFEEQFDRGLKAWTDAEAGFLLRYTEWQRDADAKYAEGEEAWINAFKMFEVKQSEWERDALRLFNEGCELFDDVSAQLNEAITQARAEFERDAALRVQSGTEQIQAWAEMYITCKSVMVEARESIDFWLSQFSAGYPPANALEEGTLKDWIYEKTHTLSRGKYIKINLSVDREFAATEINRWCDIYTSYKAQAASAMAALEREFNTVLGVGAGSLNSILDNDSEKYFLDEYQIELLRAKEIAEYWKNRYEIAKAVDNYAKTITADRKTENEGLNALKTAKEAYNRALADYEASLAALNTAGNNLEQKKQELAAITRQLKNAEEALENLNAQYFIQLDAYYNDDSWEFLNNVVSFYNKLSEVNTKRSEKDYYTAYLNSEIDYKEEEMLYDSWSLLENLIFNKEKMYPEIFNMQLSLLTSRSAVDWYYSFTKKERTAEDEAALREEGIVKRLEKEIRDANAAKESKKQQITDNYKMPVLSDLMSIEEDDDEETKAVKQEAIAKAEREAREAADAAILVEQEAVDNDPKYKFASIMLAVYQNYAKYAPGLQKENLQYALKALHGVFAEYDITTEDNAIPAVAVAADKLFEYGITNNISIGSVIKIFLLNVDTVLQLTPDVFEIHFSDWKDALIDYMAAKALTMENYTPEDVNIAITEYNKLIREITSFNSNQEIPEAKLKEACECQHLMNYLIVYNEKLRMVTSFEKGEISHWRYFSNVREAEETTDNEDEESNSDDSELLEAPGTTALVFEDTFTKSLFIRYLIEDSKEMAEEADRMLQEVLVLYKERLESEKQSLFISEANSYLENSGKPWSNAFTADMSLPEMLSDLIDALQEDAVAANVNKNGISENGQIYLAMQEGKNQIKTQIDLIAIDIKNAKTEYSGVIDSYNAKAGEYAEGAAVYEKKYNESKEKYNAINTARLEYEKQDAIQRWAGTAYLYQSGEIPEGTQYYKESADELAYCENNYKRAQDALGVLQSLYENEETARQFNDGDYVKALKDYQDSFNDTMLAYKALTETEYDIQEKMSDIARIKYNYIHELYKFVPALIDGSSYYENYKFPGLEKSTLLDYVYIIENENGKKQLGIKRNEDKTLMPISGDEAAALYNYLPKEITKTVILQSEFEEGLLAWAKRMQDFKLDGRTTLTIKLNSFVSNITLNNVDLLSLALDYLFDELSQKNPNIPALQGFNAKTDMGADGGKEIDGSKLKDIVSDCNSFLKLVQKEAWTKLSADQQDDLEFLAVLLLTGGEKYLLKGFDSVSNTMEMQNIINRANSYINTSWLPIIGRITTYEWPYWFNHDGLNEAKSAANSRKKIFDKDIKNTKTEFPAILSGLLSNSALYKDKSAELAKIKNDNQVTVVTWEKINTHLVSLKVFKPEDLLQLKNSWDMMTVSNSGMKYYSIENAIKGLYGWNYSNNIKAEQQLVAVYSKKEEERTTSQNAFRKLLDDYVIGGGGSKEALTNAAVKTYGDDTASLKTYYANIGSFLLLKLNSISADRTDYVQQGGQIAEQLIQLMQGCYQSRYGAELDSRHVEWEQQLKDLDTKQKAWQEAFGLIVLRGEQDWEEGYDNMIAAYTKWQKDFNDQAKKIDNSWNAAYLESMRNKEQWINQAIIAADEALNDNLLSSLGPDAELSSKNLDTFMPSSFEGFDAEQEAALILKSVLDSAGIANLKGAADAISGSAGTVLTATRRGVSGLTTWNSVQARAAAQEMAWNTTNELAKERMAIFAASARESAYGAKKTLENQVAQANAGIDESMDDMYLLTGGWRKSGHYYNKDIIVHSSVFEGIKTKNVVLDAYQWYVMDFTNFTTDLSLSTLEKLDYKSIEYLIKMAEKEVKDKAESIFGGEGQKGEFQEHIGEFTNESMTSQQTLKAEIQNLTKSLCYPSFIFDNQGNTGYTEEKKTGIKQDIEEKTIQLQLLEADNGEIYRLVDTFGYWEGQQAEGIAKVNAPFWDKPLWDSRGSWFEAPSIRSTVDLVNSVAATVIGAVLTPVTGGIGGLAIGYAINMTDDLIFDALDVGYGYKSWQQAGFDHGKKALITAATTAGGAAFGGVQNVAGSNFIGLTGKAVGNSTGMAAAVATTAMGAVQTFTVGTVTNALSAITFDGKNFGWDSKAFSDGMQGTLKSAAVGAVSTFTTSALNIGLEGFYGQYYNNGNKLSSLIGGLAGQGLNYAMGGDITLNVLNLNLLSELGIMKNALPSHGLVELHIGRDGVTSNLGSGGVDTSLGALYSAYKGLDAWKENFKIWTSDSDSAKNYITGMRSLVSGGEKDKALYNSILNNETNIVERKKIDGKTVSETQTIKNADGTKTIYLGADALNDRSRFGLSVVLSHEAYRDGVTGTAQEQRTETNQAVMGHIGTALGLMGTYGEGCISSAMAGEANYFSKNYAVLMSDKATAEEKELAMKEINGILYSYDSSADYWKLAKNNGRWGWEWDESFNFNFDLDNPEIAAALLAIGGIKGNGIFSINAKNLTSDFAIRLGVSLGIGGASSMKYGDSAFNHSLLSNNNALSNFVNGTSAFRDASLKAEKLIAINKDTSKLSKAEKAAFPGVVNTTINALNGALMDIQNTGLLIETRVRQASYLIGKGTDSNPYLPLPGNPYLTCLEGYRFVTEKSFTPSDTYPLNDYAVPEHPGVDMKSLYYNVVASTGGSLQYTYSSTYGIRGIITSGTGDQYISSHLAANSVLNYINVFGMSGTSLVLNDGGTYSLNGVKAGVTFGQMGSTGFSTADHVDFIVKNANGVVQPFSTVFPTQYNNMYKTPWAEKYSGIETDVYYTNNIIEYLHMIDARSIPDLEF